MQHALVWFKRDLRVRDHLPLSKAASMGRVSCVYFIEPDLWQAKDAATQHYLFIIESLRALSTALKDLGLTLNVLVGHATDCLERIAARLPFDVLLSHEETGNDPSYQRDKAVAQWCRDRSIRWLELAQFGVKRGPHNRDTWKESWQAHMQASQIDVPTHIQGSGLSLRDPIPSPASLGLTDPDPPYRQKGGWHMGQQTLTEFLTDRSQQYRGGISSPLSAPTACSRISAYLSYGCLSLREVYQTTQQQLSGLPAHAKRQRLGLNSFTSRLYWHCHFIQKLEDEPELEWRNLHRGYDGLRENDWDDARFEALVAGRTGWPLVDACVCMLNQTGWLNFRMRAMLVSVAAHPLWLHWREVGHWLARQFLDYEPGIHWSQMQMQSGTTGINVPRIYNPIKQAMDHDPRGVFVRRWLPAMRRVPQTWIFEPWLMPENLQIKYGVRVGQDIVTPVCDLELATRTARSALFTRREQPAVKAGKRAIVRKHGSRKRLEPATPRPTADSKQTQLAWDF